MLSCSGELALLWAGALTHASSECTVDIRVWVLMCVPHSCDRVPLTLVDTHQILNFALRWSQLSNATLSQSLATLYFYAYQIKGQKSPMRRVPQSLSPSVSRDSSRQWLYSETTRKQPCERHKGGFRFSLIYSKTVSWPLVLGSYQNLFPLSHGLSLNTVSTALIG